MNKYAVLGIIMVVILAGGVIYRRAFLSSESAPVSTGVVKHITIVADRDEWRFTPENIDVDRGDKLVLTIVNEDDYDHGIAIDAYGISQRMPANETITIEFVATQAGDFPFYCSVPCGEGDVHGEGHRTHFDMVGTIHVKDLVKTQNQTDG